MFNLFKNQKTKPQVQKQPKSARPFNPDAHNADLQALYECSVQRQATDFMICEYAMDDGQVVNVAMDSLDGCVKGLQSVYDVNIAGQEKIFTHFAANGFIGFNNCAILAQDWLINKCCALPCEDAISINYDITLQETDIDPKDKDIISKMKNLSDEKFKIKDICREFAENKRKFGQSLCVPLVEGVDYSLPFNIDAVKPKSYKGMVNIEPIWTSPVLDADATVNVLSERFYQPTWVRLPNGTLIHYTWFVFNTYADVPDILKPTYYFGGYPLPQLLYEQVYASNKTAKEAPMLAQSKRLNYVEGNMNAFLADEEKLTREVNLMSWLRNNWGWLLIKKDQRIGQLDTSLTDFDAVVMLGFQLVAAISGVQAARLLETSPKGWQSSGSLEDKNYSKLQLSIQTGDYCPILDKHYRLLAKSEYGLDKKYSCIFDPIDTPTEKERAEIKEINSRSDMNYIQSGVVSPEEVRSVLRNDVNSGYNALAEEMEGEEFEGEDPFGGSSNEQSPFSKDEEPQSWITTENGVHIPIEEGENKKEACKEFFKEKQSEQANKSSNTIAGVKKGKPMSFKKANEGRVNPNYSPQNLGYAMNCQTSVATFEARLRGYDIEALPFDANNKKNDRVGHEPCSCIYRL